MQLHNLIIIIVGALILYRIFLRVRRNIGWQQLNPGKMKLLTTIFVIIGLIFLIEGAFHLVSLISDIAGILFGVILAYYGGLMTRIEQRDGSWYYRPSIWIGSLVTVLFLGRLTYRIYEAYTLGNLAGSQGGLTSIGYDANTPWTSGLLLIMFAYYVVYYNILLRKHSAVSPSK
jgi:hypothetical protein